MLYQSFLLQFVLGRHEVLNKMSRMSTTQVAGQLVAAVAILLPTTPELEWIKLFIVMAIRINLKLGLQRDLACVFCVGVNSLQPRSLGCHVAGLLYSIWFLLPLRYLAIAESIECLQCITQVRLVPDCQGSLNVILPAAVSALAVAFEAHLNGLTL